MAVQSAAVLKYERQWFADKGEQCKIIQAAEGAFYGFSSGNLTVTGMSSRVYECSND